MTKLCTSKHRNFNGKQITTLLEHHRKDNDGQIIFLEEMAWPQPNGDTGDQTGAIFFQEKPPKPEFSNWFVYYWRSDLAAIIDGCEPQAPKLYITGIKTFDPVIANAIYLPDTDVLMYSRYQHDFYYDPTGQVAVDGGISYGRTLGDPKLYAHVEYNLLTKTFYFEGKTHVIDGVVGDGSDIHFAPAYRAKLAAAE